jgi:hypothetical protein
MCVPFDAWTTAVRCHRSGVTVTASATGLARGTINRGVLGCHGTHRNRQSWRSGPALSRPSMVSNPTMAQLREAEPKQADAE